MDDLLPSAFSNKEVCQLFSDDNFQSWKQQVLLGHRFYLESNLYGAQVVPTHVITKPGENFPNPAYAKCQQRDSSLAFWLLVSIFHT